MFIFPTEIWNIIIDNLEAWDSLNLRLSSKQLYKIVTHYHSYWYKQFTWYLVCYGKKPAMFKTDCDRRHKAHIPRTSHCLSLSQEEEIASNLNCTVNDLFDLIIHKPEIMHGYECTNVNHYMYDLPQTREEMPLNQKDFHPRDQVYLYRFLIHNYRHQRQKARNYNNDKVDDQLKIIKSDLTKQHNELDRIKRNIKRMKNREALLQDMKRRCDKLKENRVFYGRRSRQYKGLKIYM